VGVVQGGLGLAEAAGEVGLCMGFWGVGVYEIYLLYIIKHVKNKMKKQDIG
jgi:hypothetical protein